MRAPFPYVGGKARWADPINAALGDVTVYVEPFAGSLAVLLTRAPAQREIVCDTDGMIVNFWRAMQADPEAVAYHADYPTFHDDLTARRHWLADWRDGNADTLRVDPEYCDAQAAGWWAWCVSSWIGGIGDMLTRRGETGLQKNKIPVVDDSGGGQGVQAQRTDLGDQIPFVHHGGGGQGVQSQRTDLRDQIPSAHPHNAGRGVSAQRTDLQKEKIPKTTATGGGLGVSAQREGLRDQIPHFNKASGGRGVSAQRDELPDKIPYAAARGSGGRGVTAQRTELRDQIPRPGHPTSPNSGEGVQVQRRTGGGGVRDGIPFINHSGGGQGVTAQRTGDRPGDWGAVDPDAGIGSGGRLLHWFMELHQRLARVVVLNRSWESAVTPTLLMHTATAPKPPVGILLDPPYRIDTGRTNNQYVGDTGDAAHDAYAWAVQHGDIYRIAYAMHVGDFPVPDGWRMETMSFANARDGQRDCVIFSPACGGQHRML